MKFLLVMHLDPQSLESLPAQDRDALFAGQDQFVKEITASGEMVGTVAAADPSQSVTVQLRAIELAARIPDAKYTPVEVRPVVFDGTAEAS